MQILSHAEVFAAAEAAGHYSREDIAQALESQRWTFAKTMAWCPHEWALKRDWDGPIPWDDVVAAMACHAQPMRWRRSIRLYFDAGAWRYWWMDSTLAQVDLLNRQRLELSTCQPLAPAEPIPVQLPLALG